MKQTDKRLRAMIDRCRVPSNRRVRLDRYDTSWGGRRLRQEFGKRELESLLAEDIQRLAAAQELLFAADSWSVLVILQALDAAGKDSTIKHVMSGVNPQGCQVHAFKRPSSEELEHTFLWRSTKALPGRGRIGIFNRSYYEDVLVVRVHRGLLDAEHIPDGKPDAKLWKGRYDDINRFERHLVRNGTLILKFFLHVSKSEQRKRFLERIDKPSKHWKFSPSDLEERAYWDDYTRAYEACLAATSTRWAPWYVIPADHKWLTHALVASVLTQAIGGLDLDYPKVTKELRKQIKQAKRQLGREPR